MITLFRNFARSKWAAGLLVLLGLSLVVTGAQMDIFANLGPKPVIAAGERSMDARMFRTEFDLVVERAREQRPNVTVADLVEQNIHLRFLEERTQQLGFMDWAWKVGLRPGQALVTKRIRQEPNFFNSITGQFEQATYEAALARVNLTPALLEQSVTDEYASLHYGTAVTAGARLPRVYGALIATAGLQSRDGRWFEVTQAMAGTVGQPTDAQLTAFINENADRLRQPETRVASIVLFTADRSTTEITEERIRERFEFRKAALSTPERRTFTTLTAPSREAAQRIVQALRAGQSPEDAGRSANVKPTKYTGTPRSAVADPAVAAGVFALTANGVTEPIQSRVGFTVAKVEAINPGREATLDSAREAIREELAKEDIKAESFKRVENYEKARAGGQTLADAARAVGARVVTLPPFTREGVVQGGQRLGAPEQVFSTAYSLPKGGESEVVDAGEGQYFALRVDDVRPASLPGIAELRPQLTQAWISRENGRRLSAKAEELATRVRNGEDIAAVAGSVGATLVTRTGLTAESEEQVQSLGQGVFRGLFDQPKGGVFVQPNSASAYVVGRVDQVRGPAVTGASALASQVRPRLVGNVTNEMATGAITSAARRSKARYDIEQARIALGLPAQASSPAAPKT